MKYDPSQTQADKKEILKNICLNDKTDKDEVLYTLELLDDFTREDYIEEKQILKAFTQILKNIEEKRLKTKLTRKDFIYITHTKEYQIRTKDFTYKIMLEAIQLKDKRLIKSVGLKIGKKDKNIALELYFKNYDTYQFISSKQNTDFKEVLEVLKKEAIKILQDLAGKDER